MSILPVRHSRKNQTMNIKAVGTQPDDNHLDLLGGRFLQVVDRFGMEQPAGAPLFLSLWPDRVCREAVMAMVNEMNTIPSPQRFLEACYQLVTHTSGVTESDPWGFRVGSLKVSMLKGPMGPTRRKTPKGCQEVASASSSSQKERDLGAIRGRVEARQQKEKRLAGLEDQRMADMVRNIDAYTHGKKLPLSAAFVAAATMVVLDQEMHDMALVEAEATFEQKPEDGGAAAGHCVLLFRDSTGS